MHTAQRRLGPVRIWCSDRAGGVSRGAYASLNLADHVGDDPDHVDENRRRFCAAAGLGDPGGVVWLRQVHGDDVVVVDGPVAEPPVADGAVTTRPGLALAVLTADCAPVALACDGAVGVVHAGWVGLLAGAVENGVTAVRAAGRGPVRAYVGPCIGPDRYEFGPDDLARLVARYGDRLAATTPDGRPSLDLRAGVAAALAAAGVDDVEIEQRCTASSPELYSHRRDGVTGRQVMVAAIGP